MQSLQAPDVKYSPKSRRQGASPAQPLSLQTALPWAWRRAPFPVGSRGVQVGPGVRCKSLTRARQPGELLSWPVFAYKEGPGGSAVKDARGHPQKDGRRSDMTPVIRKE